MSCTAADSYIKYIYNNFYWDETIPCSPSVWGKWYLIFPDLFAFQASTTHPFKL